MSSFPRPPFSVEATTRALAVTILLLAGCATSTGLTGDPCSEDTDCVQGRCEGGLCTDAPARNDDATGSTPAPLDDVSGPSSEPPPRDVDPGGGGFLDECRTDEDCDSTYCLTTPLGRVCTIRCTNDEQCEAAAGWRCRRVAGRGADIEELCYPDADDLCEPCRFDTDCGDIPDRCVTLDDGDFCALDCAGGSTCPLGYRCALLDDDIEQCIPEENLCGPCRGADLDNDPTNCGECGVQCAFPNAEATCVARVCTIFACERGFANCDGDDTTGCESTLDTTDHCGACGNTCVSAAGGTVRCEDGQCVEDECPPGRASCDDNPDTGCETDIDTIDNCGACGTTCTSTNGRARCEDGACTQDPCPAGTESCDGDPDTGCETDIDTIDNCGACGTTCTSTNGRARCEDGACTQDPCPAGTESCDGDPDTGCETDIDTIDNCGACGTTCTAEDGFPRCVDGECTVSLCPPGTENCDGDPDTGCETDTEGDVLNCGACGNACTGGRVCRNGRCECPPDRVLCGEQCVTPNACGGCGNFSRSIGDDCGDRCGRWDCDGTDWTCSDERNLQSDRNHCGACGLQCRSDEICRDGTCGCPDNRIECEGQCAAPNACGGCGSLPGSPGASCGDCGSWQCDGTTLLCTGEADLQSDPANCGTCGRTCRSDQICGAGACACPSGRIECDGQCVTPNACGGCGNFSRTIGSECQNCGTWQCDGNGGWTCAGQTSTQTDPANCGTCGNVCTGGQSCSEGSCSCSSGQILCGGQCVDPNPCGGCGPLTGPVGQACGTCSSGTLQCSGSGTSANTTCQGEISLVNNNENCGACGNACTGGTVCSGTSCICPTGQRLCNGTCQTPNACGGCSTLATPPASNACGPCGLDSIVCNGQEDTICSGSTTNPCGGCSSLPNHGLTCGTCSNGTWTCNGTDALTCQGATTNACGGCGNFGRTVGSTCDGCGTWQCSGTNWTCNTPNFNTDPNNCGGCGVTCGSDQACSGGACVCNTGRPYNRVWIRSQSIQFTELTSHLQSRGYTVTRSQGGFFGSTLDNQDILVLDSAAIGPASPTSAELFAWVNNGGSVIFIGSSSSQICENLNPYLNAFGMRFSDVGNATGLCSGGGFSSASNNNLSISAHPVTRNASLNNSNLAQRNGWRIRDIGGNSARLATLSSNSNREVLRARQIGCGRVLVLADGRIATDMESGNRPFWTQAMEWLAFQR
ncbi:MAG: hypothetical protein EA398_07245 [Deltaproteobacteria bacterium]|nr:MAG: hypothetical protein EA398_07245 [Deltaproteobacteria bacterium]